MKKYIALIILATSISVYAENYETGGGYDPIAAEKADKIAREAKYKLDEKNRIIDEKNYALKQANKKKLIAKRKAANEKAALLPENMAKIETYKACINAGKELRLKNKTNWVDELTKRGEKFNIESIKDKTINIGGFECDIFASYGRPHRYNRTVNSSGTNVQFVYDGLYIYTKNGVITSWQD